MLDFRKSRRDDGSDIVDLLSRAGMVNFLDRPSNSEVCRKRRGQPLPQLATPVGIRRHGRHQATEPLAHYCLFAQ
jgi:hypothetical protein